MLRRPQRTEAACGLEARTARTLGLPLLRGLGGELNQWPRAQPSGSRLGLKREHGAYRGSVRPSHGERTSQRHAACCGSNARGVRAPPMPQDSRCMPWQSAGEHRRPRQCELSRCQRLRPALAARREWGPPESGGWTARGDSERCCMQRGKQQRSVLGDVRSAMTALWLCLTACCRQAPFLLMLDDHMSSSYPTMGCLTTTCRRVS